MNAMAAGDLRHQLLSNRVIPASADTYQLHHDLGSPHCQDLQMVGRA